MFCDTYVAWDEVVGAHLVAVVVAAVMAAAAAERHMVQINIIMCVVVVVSWLGVAVSQAAERVH